MALRRPQPEMRFFCGVSHHGLAGNARSGKRHIKHPRCLLLILARRRHLPTPVSANTVDSKLLLTFMNITLVIRQRLIEVIDS